MLSWSTACPRPIVVEYSLRTFRTWPIFVSRSMDSDVTRDSITMLHPSFAFTVNLVVHRQNLGHLEEMVGFVEQLRPDRLEIAHAQYYGWALKNRDTLIPTREQLENCMRIVEAAQERLDAQKSRRRVWMPRRPRRRR